MSWRVAVTKYAAKQLQRLPKDDANRIQAAIDEMEENPFQGDVTKLGGEEDIWRRRVGSYRILYKVLTKKRLIYVYDLRRRTSSTY